MSVVVHVYLIWSFPGQTARQTDTNKRTGRQTNNGYTRRTDRGQRDEVTDRLME